MHLYTSTKEKRVCDENFPDVMGWAKKLSIDDANSLVQTLNLLGCCQVAMK